jgi:two-component system, chemotaxis family, protein-glutamate methylesterase/glutaminase
VVRLILMRLLTLELGLDIELAANGVEAVEKVASGSPDLVILDLEMPRMDGIETIIAIHKTTPHLPILVLSAASEADAPITLKALSLGASDFLPKLSADSRTRNSVEYLRTQLVPKLRHLLRDPTIIAHRPAAPQTESRPARANLRAREPGQPSHSDYHVLAIAVSTGGPNALERLLSALPRPFPLPILIVQHLGREFTALLADRLNKTTLMPIRIASQGEILASDTVFLAPADTHMEVSRDGEGVKIRLQQGEPENSCRPSADPLFRSVAAVFGRHALGLVLTGMGHDGLSGARRIHDAGGIILAQDEKSSVVWGMPGAVANAGIAAEVLPLDGIAPFLRHLLRR